VERVVRHRRIGGISVVVTSVINTDLALALVRVVVGLVIAAHGAQKVLGVWGGPGLAGWTQGVTRMGLRAPVFWAWVSSFSELAGGIAFALGFLLPVVAAALTIQMGVAIERAHWGKGFWNTKGGIEFPFTLGAVAAINGVADPGAYSLDRALGLPAMGVGVYLAVLVVGAVAYLLSSRASRAERAKVNRAA
jgi:putative oxidoreductase